MSERGQSEEKLTVLVAVDGSRFSQHALECEYVTMSTGRRIVNRFDLDYSVACSRQMLVLRAA